MKSLIICTLLFSITPALVSQETGQQRITAVEVLDKLLERDVQREALSGGYSGNRHYLLENERMHKSAELVAAVQCGSDGTKHFEVVSESGWGSANKRVLRKMLESETDTSTPGIRPKTRLTNENYAVTMVGIEVLDGRRAYVIDLVPKRRDKYLMEGRIWVDASDYALVRAEGKPAVNPSFWTRSIHFVQQYQKQGDFWFPRSTESITEARVFGTTHVNVAYSDYLPNASSSASEAMMIRKATYAIH